MSKITFGRSDMHFLKKFGLDAAAEMVGNYRATHKTPFIYDTYQLSDILGTDRKQLYYLTNNCDRLYKQFEIAKKSGGFRTVFAPFPELKAAQRCINYAILSKYPVSRYATAYCRGVGLAENAKPHVNHKNLLKIDITDFFGSITFEMVYRTVFNTRYYPKNIGVMLTTLCCREDCLTQGAPTSPTVSNIVMRHFDDTMGKWCQSRGISYTRYSDDITFSGDCSLYAAYQKAKNFLEEMGFELNEKKTVFVTTKSRQTVTGAVVNEQLSLPREYRRKLRQEVYYALKFGFKDSVLKQKLQRFIYDLGEVDTYGYYMHLNSRIAYALQINPKDSQMLALHDKMRDMIYEL